MKKTGGFNMPKLFEENLGVVKNRSQLLKLHKKLPNYNISYLSISSGTPLKEVKQWMKELWLICHEYLDSNFSDIKALGHFYQRAWELYLCATLIYRGHNLLKHRTGPDFKIKQAGAVTNPVWIEAISVNKGDTADRVPDIVWGTAMGVPENEMLLRLSAGLDKKYQGYCSYVQNGVIKDNEPYVIAINRSELEHLDGSNPLILSCLFGIGPQVIKIDSSKSNSKTIGSFWSRRNQISKKSGAKIPMSFFDDTNHEGISAVLYVNQNIANNPRESSKMGDHFTIVLNPLARNPLPKDFFNYGNIWIKEGDVVKKIIKSKGK